MKVEPNAPTDCCHHWPLSAPMAGGVNGTCRKCGAERHFPSAVDEPRWEDEKERSTFDDDLRATAAGGARPPPPSLLIETES